MPGASPVLKLVKSNWRVELVLRYRWVSSAQALWKDQTSRETRGLATSNSYEGVVGMIEITPPTKENSQEEIFDTLSPLSTPAVLCFDED